MMMTKSISIVACLFSTAASLWVSVPRASAANFPTTGIMPKMETGALDFLANHPEYDGRGVVVAIFDSGVDPGAPGLETTTDGKPKIIDLIDASGSGDVDTSTVRHAEDGTLEGLTGRELTPDPQWQNPTGEYHLGIKRGFELFPSDLVRRLKEKTRDDFEKQNRAAINEAQLQLQKFDAEHPDPNEEESLTRQDLEDRLQVLQDMMKDFDAPGPVYDCVVFNDGEHWRAVIDTDEDGDLSEETLLTNYRDEHRFATFGKEDLLNFSVNIYQDGNRLSIVTNCHPHGTHVAGIVAGHFPDHPELNGVAPGAQIVSVKIGDTRLDGEETTSAIIRGLIRVLDDQCDLINMSYGEPTTMPDAGRLNRLISEVVNEHGVIYVSSAGNAGPALSTVGSPGGTTSAIFGVGAYVSEDMMRIQYNFRDLLPENLYTWSSRGPTFDGDLGVNFCAPGGAFAPVPNWTLQNEMQMNGTSMSSPNACGNIALILSGLKQQNISYSPAWILRGIQNTARQLDHVEPFAQGRGLLQVGKAFDYLTAAKDEEFRDVRYEVRVSGRTRRGIYLREPFETDKEFKTRVSVNPVFKKDADNERKVEFEKRIRLESSAPWVTQPGNLLLFHGGDSFEVTVDPRGLDPGAHYAEILGFNAEREDLGPLFRVPVTVAKPQVLEPAESPVWREPFELYPGKIERRFFVVPEGATWADLIVRNRQEEGERRIVAHAVQKIPGDNFRHHQFQDYLTLEAGEQAVKSFPVIGGRTIELCLAQYWASHGEGPVEAELHFHGIVPDTEKIFLDGANTWTRIQVTSALDEETIQPKASLDVLRKTVRPAEAQIRTLPGPRDQLPDERQLKQIILTYQFDVPEEGDVTPRFPALNDRLYESEFSSQVWMLFDANKRLLHVDDTWPEAVHLKKGPHTLRLQLRHEDLSYLDKVKDLPVQLDFKLSGPAALNFCSNPDQALLGENDFSGETLQPGDQLPLYLTVADAKKMPSFADAGDLLLGTIQFASANPDRLGSADRPGGFPITYRVAPKPVEAEKSKVSEKSKEEDKDPLEDLRDQVRDLKVGYLAKLYDQEAAFNEVADDILQEWPGYLPVLVEKLRRLDGDDRKEHLGRVIAAADAVINAIDTDAIAKILGTRPTDDDEESEARKKAEEQRDILADALYRKCRAFAYRDDMNEEQTPGFEETFPELQKWVDTRDDQHILVDIRNERRRQRFGTAVKLLNDHIENVPPEKRLFDKRIRIMKKLGWSHWVAYDEQWNRIRFPGKYPLF